MADGDVACQKRIMSTKTMRLPPRRALTASAQANNACGATNKRKEREDGFNNPESSITMTTTTTKLVKPYTLKPGSEPNSSNRGSNLSNELLAGYLANEFLTKGTLFGKPWDPHSSGAKGPIAIEKLKGKMSENEKGEAAAGTTPCRRAEQLPETAGKRYDERYVEVARLLKEDGAHLIGVVNPTQLARMLQL